MNHQNGRNANDERTVDDKTKYAEVEGAMPGDRRVNPQQKRSQDAEGDPIGDLRERMAKVETICKYGFPGLAAYVTFLKFAPEKVSELQSAPIKAAAIVMSAIGKQFS